MQLLDEIHTVFTATLKLYDPTLKNKHRAEYARQIGLSLVIVTMVAVLAVRVEDEGDADYQWWPSSQC